MFKTHVLSCHFLTSLCDIVENTECVSPQNSGPAWINEEVKVQCFTQGHFDRCEHDGTHSYETAYVPTIVIHSLSSV